MNEFKVSFDKFRYSIKPNKYDIAAISNRIADQIKTIDKNNIKSFIEVVGKSGCTFCPATFKGGERKKDNFEQSQLLVLDFDGGITFEAVKNRADQLNLPMLFAYNTLSSKNLDQFSVIFLNDVSISNVQVAQATHQALNTIFPEADTNCCKNVSSMYLGGKGLLYFDDSLPEIDIEALFRNMSFYLKEKYGVTHYKSKIEKFSKATGIALTNKKLLDISIEDDFTEVVGRNSSGKNMPKSTVVLTNFGKKLHKHYIINFHNNCINSCSEKNNKTVNRPYRSSMLKDIGSNCKLFQEFKLGSRKLHHKELFGLATNLIQIESGVDEFKNILSSNNFFDYKNNTCSIWEYYLHYIRSKHYSPDSCDNYCSYRDNCLHGKNILSTTKVSYSEFQKLANYNEHFVSLSEAEEDFKQRLIVAMDADDTNWHVIKAQTAIGKTKTYLELIKDTSKKVLIAVPTNHLKHEVQERAAALKIEMAVSPSLHEIKSELTNDVWVHIENLYKSGKSPNPYIRKLIKQNHKCSEILKDHLKKLDAFHNYHGHAVTTHRRLSGMDVNKYDLIIVDEDIIFSTVARNKFDITIRDLKKLQKKNLSNNPLAKKIKQVLEKIKSNEFFDSSEIEYNQAYEDISTTIDISSFCSATRFNYRKSPEKDSCKKEDCISFYTPVAFPKNIKYIMVSATVNETVCKYTFGEEKLKFYMCKRAWLTGNLNQYPDKSMSRACIDKDTASIDTIKDWSGFKHTISFKYLDLDDLHFGNTEGCDYLKGENIDVIGTPHQPEWIYKLFAYTFRLNIDTDAKLKPHMTVDHNGWRFRFTTFENIILRNIQFWMIESELEQAVGRARLLRYNCTVNLFSNFPLSQAVLKEAEYEKLY
ncbi:MAG: DEAD/DEAH box helicase family protein [Ruminiclostridium sp.]